MCNTLQAKLEKERFNFLRFRQNEHTQLQYDLEAVQAQNEQNIQTLNECKATAKFEQAMLGEKIKGLV